MEGNSVISTPQILEKRLAPAFVDTLGWFYVCPFCASSDLMPLDTVFKTNELTRTAGQDSASGSASSTSGSQASGSDQWLKVDDVDMRSVTTSSAALELQEPDITPEVFEEILRQTQEMEQESSALGTFKILENDTLTPGSPTLCLTS